MNPVQSPRISSYLTFCVTTGKLVWWQENIRLQTISVTDSGLGITHGIPVLKISRSKPCLAHLPRLPQMPPCLSGCSCQHTAVDGANVWVVSLVSATERFKEICQTIPEDDSRYQRPFKSSCSPGRSASGAYR